MKNLKWYKVHEVAKKTGLSKYSVRKMIDNGTITGGMINGQRLVEEQHLKEFSEKVMFGLVDLSVKRTPTGPVEEHLRNWDDSETRVEKEPEPEDLGPPERGQPQDEPDPGEDPFEDRGQDQLEEYLKRKRTKEILEE